MSYFTVFPKTMYEFDNELVATTNLAADAEVLDEVRLSSSFYQDYYIMNGERPDHVAFNFYGDPQLHWVMYLMNPKLREQGWPMSQAELVDKVKKDHPNSTLTIDVDITSLLSVGQEIKGYTSEAIGTIVHINLDLGQVTVRTDGTFQAGELIQDTATSAVYAFTLVGVVKEHLAVHHYEINGEFVDINPYDISLLAIPITIKEFYIRENDGLKQIRLIKPDAINQVVSAFRQAIQS